MFTFLSSSSKSFFRTSTRITWAGLVDGEGLLNLQTSVRWRVLLTAYTAPLYSPPLPSLSASLQTSGAGPSCRLASLCSRQTRSLTPLPSTLHTMPTSGPVFIQNGFNHDKFLVSHGDLDQTEPTHQCNYGQ